MELALEGHRYFDVGKWRQGVARERY
ncbi:hypothetical protein [Sphingobacterium suaedae]|uniref:RagB/SusD family nutrient uptake outer membrane protein n=1 Tax=Sphingobacterium suaedae TaxID=1686402 RepID=A0ABW5KLS2_9SPHI